MPKVGFIPSPYNIAKLVGRNYNVVDKYTSQTRTCALQMGCVAKGSQVGLQRSTSVVKMIYISYTVSSMSPTPAALLLVNISFKHRPSPLSRTHSSHTVCMSQQQLHIPFFSCDNKPKEASASSCCKGVSFLNTLPACAAASPALPTACAALPDTQSLATGRRVRHQNSLTSPGHITAPPPLLSLPLLLPLSSWPPCLLPFGLPLLLPSLVGVERYQLLQPDSQTVFLSLCCSSVLKACCACCVTSTQWRPLACSWPLSSWMMRLTCGGYTKYNYVLVAHIVTLWWLHEVQLCGDYTR